jgi:FAD/FMN-containing dehydrogenase
MSNINSLSLPGDLAEAIPAERFITDVGTLDRLSKDFYWYSPVLERQLKDKRADIAIVPNSIEEIQLLLAHAYAHDLPVTLRGAGTGNYGQAVPLYGGLLLDLSGMDQILEINEKEGYIVAQAGTRLGTMEEQARRVGLELCCYPSTFVKATLGGFLCGGTGGVGSVTHGSLREKGMVRGVEIVTLEASPRRIWLRGEDCLQMLHAYGTNGLLVTIELKLVPKVRWGQIAASFATFAQCFDLTDKIAQDASISKRLTTCFEWPIPSYFKPIKKYIPEGSAMTFLEVDESQMERVEKMIADAGGSVTFRQGYQEPRKGPLLSDYTWNHTTLWALKADPSLTYLQCGFDREKAREQFAQLKEKFGDEFLFHIEYMKMDGVMNTGSAPIIRFTTEERLREMMDFCAKIGVGVANPHTYVLGGGHGRTFSDSKTEAKKIFDPKGLLNPGKLSNYPLPKGLQPIPTSFL